MEEQWNKYTLGITFQYPENCDIQQPFGPRGVKTLKLTAIVMQGKN